VGQLPPKEQTSGEFELESASPFAERRRRVTEKIKAVHDIGKSDSNDDRTLIQRIVSAIA
jgi:hypothetical protein